MWHPGATLSREVGAGAAGTCGTPEAALSREVGTGAVRTCGAARAALSREVVTRATRGRSGHGDAYHTLR
jgi:hypothetical protein